MLSHIPRGRCICATHMHRAVKIVRFLWNLIHYIRYWTRLRSRDQKLKFFIFEVVTAAILKNRFLAITHQPIVRCQRNFASGSRKACPQNPRDKNCKFLKCKMTAAILKIVKLPLSQWKYCWILTKFGVLQHVLNLMRFSKALYQNLRCDKVTINE